MSIAQKKYGAVDYAEHLRLNHDALGREFLGLCRGSEGDQAANRAIDIADGYEGGARVLLAVELVGWYRYGVKMPDAKRAYVALDKGVRRAIALRFADLVDSDAP